jgi:16S rRNA G966 N2-methylase RsmD
MQHWDLQSTSVPADKHISGMASMAIGPLSRQSPLVVILKEYKKAFLNIARNIKQLKMKAMKCHIFSLSRGTV